MTRLGREHLADMSHEGDDVRARRERLGMDKKELAEAAGINRNTLHALETGQSFNRSTLTKVERMLAELEAEAGIGAPSAAQPGDPHMVTIRGTRGGDIDVVVSGPIGDIDKLAETVERLLRNTEARKAQAEDDPNES